MEDSECLDLRAIMCVHSKAVTSLLNASGEKGFRRVNSVSLATFIFLLESRVQSRVKPVKTFEQ